MNKYVVLYNPHSGNGNGKKYAKKLDDILYEDELTYKSMPEIKDFKRFFNEYPIDIIICGGDGTLNYFINKVKNIKYNNSVYYFSTGSGNDFYNDTECKNKLPYNIDAYLKDLPVVIVNDKEYKFINGVGFGIDGYCCEEGDKIKAKTKNPVNYTSIAFKGLVKYYKPRKAKITVDGKTYKYDNVYLVPTMNGRFYGGGMMITPMQDRLNEEKTLTLAVAHSKSRLKILLAFPLIFSGKHVKKKKLITFYTGHDFEVEFDKPCALQIDGDTILDVKKYKVYTK